MGASQKEFFHLTLKDNKHYFDKGLRELLSDKYHIVGKILSIITVSDIVN